MRKTIYIGWLAAMAMMMAPMAVTALPLSHFASQSKLAHGKWVKIAVTESGMHQITAEQLRQMGFNDPNKIQVYGKGGKMMDQVLTIDLPDDLQQIPVLRRSDKICFYATGAASLSLINQSNRQVFVRSRNTYTTKAYYFITEATKDLLSPATSAYHAPASPTIVTTSINGLLHEQEKMSVALTGSELLGEDLLKANQHLDFQLINPSDKQLGITSRIAARVARRISTSGVNISGNFWCKLTTGQHTVDVPYSTSATNINGCVSEFSYYQLNSTSNQSTAWVELPDTCHAGSLHYGMTLKPNDTDAVLQLNRLDYFVITYNHYNTLNGQPYSQCPMGLAASTDTDIVRIQGNGLVVWNITTPDTPIEMKTSASAGCVQFTPGEHNTPQQYVAFAPSGTLREIDGFEPIDNQNLHALPVPDMLIITNKVFISQAERVAQLHRQVDGMDVLVLDQEQVFNEFSSGTPDAMAIRLLCKMFYDRNSTKFRYLLLFGNMSFDNRGIASGKQNRVISYVSSVSNNEDNSYINNDFYGYLLDGSGQRISSDRLCLGIGHMPVANAIEAELAVDKLQEYVYGDNYGSWRNNYSLWAENSTFKSEGEVSIWETRSTIDSQGNDSTYRVKVDSIFQLHESHAAGIGYIIDHDAKTQMVRDLAFVRMFPQSLEESFKAIEKRVSTEGKRHIKEMFNEGQYFATYVGHAGATGMSATGLWTSNDVINTPYPHWPIMTTACCDVARFDGDSRGVCELMFHKRDGGAIALFTTTRQVLATMNDDLNRTFTSAMFSYHTTGKMPYLGDCYRTAKNYYSNSNTNKFHWVLLGDPALRVNYPKPLFNITAINGKPVDSGQNITAAPLQRITIDAQVMTEGTGTLNKAFNGDATVTIYGAERVAMDYVKGTGAHSHDTMTVAYPREKLVQVSGRVVAGKFHGSVVMPRYARTSNNPMLVSIYAHQDGTDQMVNGLYDQLKQATYNTSLAVDDKVSPVIEAMYLNNEQQFAANATVGTEATLYIRATDNTSFNTQRVSLGSNMRVTLDGGMMSYYLTKDLATVTDEGRALAITMPLHGLLPGQHTLQFTVSDVCGNTTTQAITFVVSSQKDLKLIASDVASAETLQIDLGHFDLLNQPLVTLHVTDINGNLVWSKQTATFPCTWDLKDKQGRRVANGVYRIYGNYSNDEGTGGSNLIHFVALPAVKHN